MSKARKISIRITSRGQKIIGFLLIVLTISALFRDPLLITATGILLLYIFTQNPVLKTKLDTLGRSLKTETISGTVVAGEFYRGLLVFEDELSNVRIVSPFENGVFSRSDDLGSYVFLFQPMLAGQYVSDSFSVEVSDSYDIWFGECILSVDFNVNVYPRVFPEAVRVMEFLLSGGAAYQGDVPYRLRGSGLEYAESRMYQPGDSLKSFDWKAMARTLKPMVKQYYAEGGGGLLLVAELGAPDPVSADLLSAELLRWASSLVAAEYQFKLAILDDNTLHGYLDEQPEILLRIALRHALGDHVKTFRAYYEVLDPASADNVNEILDLSEQDINNKILYDELLQSPTNSEIQCILVSSLTENPKKLLELLSKLRGTRYTIRHLDPTKPWIHAMTLEEAYMILQQRRKIARILDDYGAQVILHPSDAYII